NGETVDYAMTPLVGDAAVSSPGPTNRRAAVRGTTTFGARPAAGILDPPPVARLRSTFLPIAVASLPRPGGAHVLGLQFAAAVSGPRWGLIPRWPDRPARALPGPEGTGAPRRAARRPGRPHAPRWRGPPR